MGSKTKTVEKTNQTQTAAPPSWAEPTMIDLANKINAAAQTVSGIPAYTGDFVAQPGALQNQVPQAYLDAAAMAKSLIAPAQQAFGQLQTPASFDYSNLVAPTTSYAASDPNGMVGAIQSAINPVYRNLMEQILPSLQSSGIESGAYGGTRAQQTLPQLMVRDANREMMDIAAGLEFQDYNANAARQLEAYGLSTGRGLGEANVLTDRLGLTPDLLDAIMRMSGGSAELSGQAAAIDAANRQAAIDNQLQKYQYGIQQPFMGYDIATDLISRLSQGYGTTTMQGTNTTTQKTGGLAPIVGGALGLAGMVGGFPMAGGGSLGGSLVSQLFGKK